MKTNKLVVGETYSVKAIEIQKNLTLTKLKMIGCIFKI